MLKSKSRQDLSIFVDRTDKKKIYCLATLRTKKWREKITDVKLEMQIYGISKVVSRKIQGLLKKKPLNKLYSYKSRVSSHHLTFKFGTISWLIKIKDFFRSKYFSAFFLFEWMYIKLWQRRKNGAIAFVCIFIIYFFMKNREENEEILMRTFLWCEHY